MRESASRLLPLWSSDEELQRKRLEIAATLVLPVGLPLPPCVLSLPPKSAFSRITEQRPAAAHSLSACSAPTVSCFRCLYPAFWRTPSRKSDWPLVEPTGYFSFPSGVWRPRPVPAFLFSLPPASKASSFAPCLLATAEEKPVEEIETHPNTQPKEDVVVVSAKGTLNSVCFACLSDFSNFGYSLDLQRTNSAKRVRIAKQKLLW